LDHDFRIVVRDILDPGFGTGPLLPERKSSSSDQTFVLSEMDL